MRKDRAMDRHDRSSVIDPDTHGDDTTAHKPGTPPDATQPQRAGVIWNPNSVQGDDGEIQIWKATPAALTISRIQIGLNSAANEVLGDLKYADDFISLANPVVINDFDTTSGVRDDSSITVGAVPAGKCLYFSFDSSPDVAITQMYFEISYTFD